MKTSLDERFQHLWGRGKLLGMVDWLIPNHTSASYQDHTPPDPKTKNPPRMTRWASDPLKDCFCKMGMATKRTIISHSGDPPPPEKKHPGTKSVRVGGGSHLEGKIAGLDVNKESRGCENIASRTAAGPLSLARPGEVGMLSASS